MADTNPEEPSAPPRRPSLLVSAMTAIGIALAVASFVWIHGDEARFSASAVGLALVLWGVYLRRRTDAKNAPPADSVER